MNEEEKKYLPYLRAALEATVYPADAIELILESPFAAHLAGEAWRNHMPLDMAKAWFIRRWLPGPNRAYWLWQPGMELASFPQDVALRASETMKRRKKPVDAESAAHSAFGAQARKPSR